MKHYHQPEQPPRTHVFKVPCPHCNTAHQVTAIPKSFMALTCLGCSREIIACADMLFSMHSDDMALLEYLFEMEICGKVTGYSMQKRYSKRGTISEEAVSKIREVLNSEDPFTGIQEL